MTRPNILGGATGTSSGSRALAQESPAEGTCSICNGFGWVRREVPVGHAEFGQAFPCECQLQDLEQEDHRRLRRYSNLGPLVRLTFENFIPTGRSGDPANRELLKKAYQRCWEFAQKPEGWLVVTGPSGCGKTHLAAAIANQCLAHNRVAFFIGIPDLLDHLRATFAPTSEVDFDILFEQVRDATALILDDLGAHSGTPWAQEKLFQLFNHRFTARLPTVVTAAVPLSALDERLRTRLTDPDLTSVLPLEKATLVSFTGSDALEEEHSDKSFEAFDVKRRGLSPEQSDNLERAFRTALGYAESPDGWQIFLGGRGCGKTHLAAAIAHFRRRQGDEVVFVKVSDLLDYLRDKFSPESGVSYYEAFERVKRVRLLVLDEFGEHVSTRWAKEKLYQIIDYRYNARIPTVITSSLSLDEMDGVIASRIADVRVCLPFHIQASDYRDTGKPRLSPRRDESERQSRRAR